MLPVNFRIWQRQLSEATGNLEDTVLQVHIQSGQQKILGLPKKKKALCSLSTVRAGNRALKNGATALSHGSWILIISDLKLSRHNYLLLCLMPIVCASQLVYCLHLNWQ